MGIPLFLCGRQVVKTVGLIAHSRIPTITKNSKVVLLPNAGGFKNVCIYINRPILLEKQIFKNFSVSMF